MKQINYATTGEGLTKLVTVLVGPPCTGKSTYLKSIDYDFSVSSDEIVETLCRKASIRYHDFFQLPPRVSIRKLHKELFNQVVSESTMFNHVVWDLTNLTIESRKRIFKYYPSAIFNAVVFEFSGNEKLILERNILRYKKSGKLIEEKVLQNMFLKYEPIDYREKFSSIKVIKYPKRHED